MIKARDIMSKEVKYIQEDVTIKETLIRMKGEETSSFIVERKAFLDLPKDGGSAGESMDALIHEAYSDECIRLIDRDVRGCYDSILIRYPSV